MKTIQEVARHTAEYAVDLSIKQLERSQWATQLMKCWNANKPESQLEFRNLLRSKYGLEIETSDGWINNIIILDPHKVLLFQIKYPI